MQRALVRSLIIVFASSACTGARVATPAPPGDLHILPAPGSRFADSVLALLSLEEKIGQLTMSPAEGLQTGPHVAERSAAQVRQGLIGSVIGVTGVERIHELQRVAVEESPHRIPVLFSLDVIHGFRTNFPVPLAEAATFDPALAEADARIAADEATANGIVWNFAPMVDIACDPRWGRIVEGAGEEPYVGSVFADARVRGFQGRRLSDSTSLLATAKHFVGYGASLDLRALTTGQHYYFAIESFDENGVSPLSGIVRIE